jgi:hypothetical protein
MRKCLLIEPLSWHEELFPNWVYLLNDLSYFVDIYTSQANIQKGAMDACHLKNFQFHNINRFGELSFHDYDFAILNSLIPEGFCESLEADPLPNLALLSKLPLPMISVVHDPAFVTSQLGRKPPLGYSITDHLRSPKNALITYCKHAKKWLARWFGDVEWILPTYFGDFAPCGQRRHLSFSGCLHQYRKNFDSLFQSAQQLEQLTNDIVQVVGGARSEAAFRESEWVQLLKRRISEHQLEDKIQFTGFLDCRAFFDRVMGSKMLLPLVDLEVETGAYGIKLTTSAAYALAFSVPLIVNEDIAAQYDMEYMICYPGGELSRGIEKFLQMSESSYDGMVAKTIKQRDDYAAMNRSTLAKLIHRITSAHAA